MRLVGRMARKVASKLDLAAMVARRKELRVKSEVVEAPVVEVPTAVEAPIEVIEEAVEVDFLDMEVDERTVLEAAWIVAITEDAKHYGAVIRSAGSLFNYKQLFRHIDLAEEQVRKGFNGRLPDTLVTQASRWKNNIQRKVEGKYCPTCWERDWRYFWREFSDPAEVATKVEGNDIVCQSCNTLMGWVKTPRLNA